MTVAGIPSRDCLEQRKLPYSLMVTDVNDHRNGVWDKVFVNLQDYGEIFANGRDGTPTAYGPIVFKINPEAFSIATEVALTLRSAGAFNFNRQQESLCSMDEIERIFCYSSGPLIKFGNNLRRAFPERPTICVESVEIHCVYPDHYLPLEYVEKVLVDPYQIKGKNLQFFVNGVGLSFRVRFGISTRVARNESRQRLYNELCSFLISSILSNRPIPSLEDLLYSSSVSRDMKEWAQRIFDRNMAWQFERFATYLCNSTLRPVLQCI